MAEESILGPRYVHLRALIVLIGLLVVPAVCAIWLNGWNLFAFPLGTFLVALGVPFGLVAVAATIPRALDLAEDDEAPLT